MKENSFIFVLFVVLLAFATSCSTTRRLPNGEQLYIGTKKIEYTADESSPVPPELRSQIKDAVHVSPNNYLKLFDWRYPFPLGLWVYNNWPNPESGFRHWMYETFVEEPVLVSDVRPHVRTKMIEQMLANNGYFRAKASYELDDKKNPRKAKVQYRVTTGKAFTINSIRLPKDTVHLNHLIDSIARRDSYLQVGARYSADSLGIVRNRITNSLRDRGYYFFRPDYIEYLADSTITSGEIVLEMKISDEIPAWAGKRYLTGDVKVVVNRYRGRQTPDTVVMRPGLTLIQMMPSRLRREIVPECVTFRAGRPFAVRDMNSTQTYFSRLGIFRSIAIEAVSDTTASNPTLNVNVNCTFDAPLEASAEVNIASKSNSYLGPGVSLGLTHRNIFGGGEQLGVNVTGAYEWQTGSGHSSLFNSYELGLRASLAFPRVLAPAFVPRGRSQLNWTRFQIDAELLNRPHYFKMAQFNTGVSYDWRWRRHVSHSLTPLKLTYTKLMHTTAEFDSVMAANPAVAQSFENQFIPQMSYTYTYDRRVDSRNNLNLQFTLQEAGNVFWGIWSMFGANGEKTLFGMPFSQFVKGQAQVVWNHKVLSGHNLVARLAAGAAHAYGNSSQMPYSEQFYCGGANSVRAFTVRSIGPGSYRDPEHSSDDYFDQTGTFKFEANIEYRFNISGALYGALFFDAGNVWLLENDPMRPGGKLRASSFFDDLATGTGIGLRFDMDMLVVRGDLGIGIHAPYDTGKSGYYNMSSFKNSLAFHLAIGYPF